MTTNSNCKKPLTTLIYEKLLFFIFPPVYNLKFNWRFCSKYVFSLKVRQALQVRYAVHALFSCKTAKIRKFWIHFLHFVGNGRQSVYRTLHKDLFSTINHLFCKKSRATCRREAKKAFTSDSVFVTRFSLTMLSQKLFSLPSEWVFAKKGFSSLAIQSNVSSNRWVSADFIVCLIGCACKCFKICDRA